MNGNLPSYAKQLAADPAIEAMPDASLVCLLKDPRSYMEAVDKK